MRKTPKKYTINQAFNDIIYLAKRQRIIEDGMHQLRLELELFDDLTDIALDKIKETDKLLFRFIIHLAKNGEIRTLLDSLLNEGKKPLEIVVAFDGDEAGKIARNRFVVGQLTGDPKKYKISANLQSNLNKALEEMEGMRIHYTETLSRVSSLFDKKKKGRWLG